MDKPTRGASQPAASSGTRLGNYRLVGRFYRATCLHFNLVRMIRQVCGSLRSTRHQRLITRHSVTQESTSVTTHSPIFLVGLSRSGSTLWTNTLRAHPDVTVFTEMHFLTPWRRDFRYVLKKVGDLQHDRNVERLVDTMFADPPVRGLARGFHFWRQIRELETMGLRSTLKQRIIASSDRSIGFIFRTLIQEATRCRGANRPVVKFPVYPVYLEQLIDWWPNASIIHISRDPRSLAASKMNDPGGIGKLKQQYAALQAVLSASGKTFAVLQYVWTSHVPGQFSSKPNYRVFLYENLLTQPEATIHEVCEFCGLLFHDAMLNPTEGQASSVTGAKASGFDPSRIHGWRKVLSPWEAKLIARLTKRSMERFGYTPSM